MSVDMTDRCGPESQGCSSSDSFFPSGIVTKLYCPVWKDREQVSQEIEKALDLCITDLDNHMFQEGWTGIALWFIH